MKRSWTDGRVARSALVVAGWVALLLLAGCGGPVDPTAGIASLRVTPGSVLLTADGATAALTVRAYDAQGREKSLSGVALDWSSSDGTAVGVAGGSGGPGTATVVARTALGSAVVTVAVRGHPALVSQPAPVTVAELAPGVRVVAPQRIVFPFDAPPPGAGPATYLPPHVSLGSGDTMLGSFSEHDVGALFELDPQGELRTGVVITASGGPRPSVGDLLVSGGGGAFMGRVASVTERTGYLLLQLDPVALTDVYAKLRFRYDGPSLAAQGLRPAPVAAASDGVTGQANCTFKGSLTGVAISTPLPTLTVALTPDVLIDTERGIYKVLLPVKVTITMEPGIDLQPGAKGSMVCELGGPYKSLWSLPGPLAALFAVSAELHREFEASADFSAGPRLAGKLTLKGEADLQVGFDTSTPNADHNTVDVKASVAPSGTADGPLSDDLKFQLTAKLVEVGDLGVQLGGYVVGTGAQYLNWIPYLGAKIQKVAEALDLQILKSEVGPVGDAIWESAKRVLNQEGANTTVALNAVGAVTLESDTLNTMLEKIGHGPLSFTLFKAALPLGTLHRVFDKDQVRASTSCFSGVVGTTPVCVRVGETAEFTVRVKYKGAPLLFGSDKPLLGGQVWLAKSDIIGVHSSVNASAKELVFRVPITADMCGSFLSFIALNDIGGIETPGYGGKAPLACSGGPATYTLSVDPPTSGSVQSDPPGIDCGSDCSEPYPAGTVVSLTPTPDSGMVFDHWTGDCSGSGACTLTMDGPRHVGLAFGVMPPGGIVPLGEFGSPFAGDGEAAMAEAVRYVFQGWGAGALGPAAASDGLGNLPGTHLSVFAGAHGYVVVDLVTGDVVLDATSLTGGPYFGVEAVTHGTGGPDAPAALLAFGAGGWAVQTYDPVSKTFATPVETGSSAVYDASPAGGALGSDLLPFAQPATGVHFLAFDGASSSYAVNAEVLPAGALSGELVSAFVPSDALAPDPLAPALVLTRGVTSELYLVPRDGGAVQGPVDLGLDARKLRCLQPAAGADWVCAVTEFGADRITVLTWDGSGLPVIQATPTVGDGPVDVGLALLGNGHVAMVTTGFYDGSVTELEVDAAGSVVQSVSDTVVSGCVNPGHATYFEDAEGWKVLATCYTNSHYVVRASGL